MNKFLSGQYDPTVFVNDMTITLRPQTYKEFTQTAIKTFEEQRIAAVINDENMTDEEKLGKFNESFIKLTGLTIDLVVNSIVSIQTSDGEIVTDRGHIADFMKNADKDFFTAITKKKTEKTIWDKEPIKVQATEEELEAGAPKEYTIPVTFRPSKFFFFSPRISTLSLGDLKVVKDRKIRTRNFKLRSHVELCWVLGFHNS